MADETLEIDDISLKKMNAYSSSDTGVASPRPHV